MKCPTCNKSMNHVRQMQFNEHRLDGWRCSCGEVIFNPEQVQRVLLLNKLRREAIRATLGQVRSNLILRLPKDVEQALDLHKGEEVLLSVREGELRMVPA